jgi:Trk K+ transport system NAD-binding subunit
VVVIEENQHNTSLQSVRACGAKVIIGNALTASNLEDACIEKAAALLSLINNDMQNLEIGLNAQALKPSLRLILRIFDKSVADEIRSRFGIQFAFSTSSLTAETIATELLEKMANE